jgi:hypothetical protein
MKSAVSVLLCLMGCGSLLAQAPSIKTGTVEQIKVRGKSLEGNLEGNSPDRDVFVYLPTVDGELRPTIAAEWVANSPMVMIDQYLTNLKKYSQCGRHRQYKNR